MGCETLLWNASVITVLTQDVSEDEDGDSSELEEEEDTEEGEEDSEDEEEEEMCLPGMDGKEEVCCKDLSFIFAVWCIFLLVLLNQKLGLFSTNGHLYILLSGRNFDDCLKPWLYSVADTDS